MDSEMNRDSITDALTGMVSNIQHYCTEDGPGIRTTVFLKGCSLACKWCANPESLYSGQELAYNPNYCIGQAECGLCIEACPESAVTVPVDEKKVTVDFSACTHCGKCVDVCPAKAMTLFGQKMTVDEVMEEVEKDGGFFYESGGGLTLSGGECLGQPEFAAALLKAAHDRGYNTVVETAFNVPFDNIETVLPHVDLVFVDIKIVDPDRHKQWTGVNNKRILENLHRACTAFPDTSFIVRTPVVPGINDSADDVRAVLDLIRPYRNVIAHQLLAYHRFGLSRYEYMGKKYELAAFPAPEKEDIKCLGRLIDEAFDRKESYHAQSFPPGLLL